MTFSSSELSTPGCYIKNVTNNKENPLEDIYTIKIKNPENDLMINIKNKNKFLTPNTKNPAILSLIAQIKNSSIEDFNPKSCCDSKRYNFEPKKSSSFDQKYEFKIPLNSNNQISDTNPSSNKYSSKSNFKNYSNLRCKPSLKESHQFVRNGRNFDFILSKPYSNCLNSTKSADLDLKEAFKTNTNYFAKNFKHVNESSRSDPAGTSKKKDSKAIDWRKLKRTPKLNENIEVFLKKTNETRRKEMNSFDSIESFMNINDLENYIDKLRYEFQLKSSLFKKESRKHFKQMYELDELDARSNGLDVKDGDKLQKLIKNEGLKPKYRHQHQIARQEDSVKSHSPNSTSSSDSIRRTHTRIQYDSSKPLLDMAPQDQTNQKESNKQMILNPIEEISECEEEKNEEKDEQRNEESDEDHNETPNEQLEISQNVESINFTQSYELDESSLINENRVNLDYDEVSDVLSFNEISQNDLI